MKEADIKDICDEASKMAARLGGKFVPDPQKIKAFKYGPDDWSPQKLGRAVHFIWVLANTPVSGWRTKNEIHAGLSEFKDGQSTGE